MKLFKFFCIFDDIVIDVIVTRKVIIMLEKIERIARIKHTENDVSKRFDRKHGYKDERNPKKKFSTQLQAAVERREHNDAATVQLSPAAVAASVQLTSTPSHSLFYFSGLSLNQLIAESFVAE